MPSEYIQPSEYPVYGLPSSTTQSQVYEASLLVDAFLRRPEGMVWSPDWMGLPAYMAGLNPSLTFQSSGSITAGSKVAVPLTKNVPAWSDMIGEVVILDRSNQSAVEACVITAMTTGQITLGSVVNNHNPNCTIDFGLTIFEEKSLPSQRSITRTSRSPVRLLSGMGRYGYGRKTDQEMGMYNEVNLLAAIQAFGGPPMWVPFDVSQASVSYTTREVWVPAGILMAYFSEVRLRYISGFQYSALPPIIKQATAQIVSAFQANPELQGQLKSIGAGNTKIERFAPSQIDNDTRLELEQFRINLVI